MSKNDDDSKPEAKQKNKSAILRLAKRLFRVRFPKKNSSINDSKAGDDDERERVIEKSIEQLATQLSASDTPLEKAEKEMIHGIVELGEKSVKEIMVPRVEIVGIEVSTPLKEIIEIIKQTGHSRLPIFQDSLDNIKGLIYAKDLLGYALNSEEVDLAQIARKPYFIPENKMVDELLKDLRKRRLHIAIVVDEYGGTSGLVTMEDIFEEIVGEIEDEYDHDAPAVVETAPNVYSVDGSLSIADLNSELNLNIPENEFETVGGLIYDLVGSLPEKGSKINCRNLAFIVDKIEGQRIVRVRLINNVS